MTADDPPPNEADLLRTLLASRDGHTACQWCEVRCRHFCFVEVDYAPDGVDVLLDDFEPAYAVCAMLDLKPEQQTPSRTIMALRNVNRTQVYLSQGVPGQYGRADRGKDEPFRHAG